MRLLLLIWFFLLPGIAGNLSAQGVPPVESLSSDRLAYARAWMITKGCDGYLYVANDKGILIFNGFSTHQVELPNGVKARSVYLGKDCRVYVGGYQDFGYLQEEEGHHPTFVSLADEQFRSSTEEIWQIFANEEYMIFQSFSAVFRLKNGEVEKFVPPSNIMLGKDIDGRLLIPSLDGERLYELKEDGFDTRIFGKEFSDKKITAVAPLAGSEDVLIATQRNGLYRFTEDKIIPVSSVINEYAARYQLNRVLLLHNGDYAFGTILNGLYITDSQFRVKYSINQEHGLMDNTVLALYEDEENQLFVGMDQGVNTVSLQSANRYYYPATDFGRIYSAIEHEGIIYLATNRGVFKFVGQHGQLIAGTQGQAWKLHLVDGELFCAHNTGTLEIKPDGANKIAGSTGTWWLQTMNDSTIIQSTYTGLSTLTRQGGEWQASARMEDGGLQLIKFHVSPANDLVGIHPHVGYYTAQLSEDYGRVLNQRRHQPEDTFENLADAEIIFLGQAVYFLVGGDFFELAGDVFVSITADSPGFTTLQALKCELDLQNENDAGGTFTLTDSTYLFPNGYGFYVQQNFRDCSLPLRDVNIQYFKVDDDPALRQDSVVSLKPNFSKLTVQLEKDIVEKGHFRYVLKGWNKSWMPLGPEGEIIYENINPGTYELLLGIPGSQTRRLARIVVRFPWYQTSAGYALFAFLGLLFLYLLKRYSDQRMKTQALVLQRETERKLKEVNISNENKQLQQALIHKSEQLANSAMVLVKRDKLLNELKQQFKKLELSENQATFKNELVRKIERDTKEDWELFQTNFTAVHQEFFERLAEKHPGLSHSERQLAAYIRMDLRSKEIAPLFNISIRSLENKRYRLRLSLGLDHGGNLKEYIQQI